jgi:VWFA-related protein
MLLTTSLLRRRSLRSAALRLIAVSLLTLAAITSAAQAPAPSESTTFRSSTRLVLLDVVVTDSNGKPVRGLAQEDFAVLEDRAPQRIAFFDSVQPGADPVTAASRGDKSQSGPPPAAKAELARTILVLDELNSEVTDQAFGRASIEKFLRLHGPRLPQPTSLLLLGQQRLELLQDYTQDANALMQAMHKHHAELPFGLLHAELDGVGERLSRTLWAVRQIAAANSHFAARKNLIWVGPGFPAINPALMLTAEDRKRLQSVISETADLLMQSRAVIYTVDPRGLPVTPTIYSQSLIADTIPNSFTSETSGDLLFEDLAPQTGGKVFRLRNDVDVAIGSSADDGAAYYTLAYYPANRNWDGKFRAVEVTVRRAGLQARTRKGYLAYAEAPLDDNQIDTVLSRAVMNPLTYRGLLVTAAVNGPNPRNFRVEIKVERSGLDWHTLPDGRLRSEVTAVVASVAADDTVRSHKVTELETVTDPKSFTKQPGKPVRFNLPANLVPGTRHIRVVVRDVNNGNIGSYDIPRESLPVR